MASEAAVFQPPAAIFARADAATGAGSDSGGSRTVPGISLNAAVTAAVRQVIDHPALDSETNARLDPERDDDAVENQTAPLASAVVAEHETRIQVLKARIEALRVAGGALSLIADLDVRLHRAEAARRLAVARADLGPTGSDCAIAVVPASCHSKLATTASTADVASPVKGHLRHAVGHRPRPDAKSVAGPLSRHQWIPLAARSTPMSQHTALRDQSIIGQKRWDGPVRFLPATLTRWSAFAAPVSVRVAIGGPVVRRIASCRNTASRLSAARRSLATARRLLEGKGEHGVQRMSLPPTMIAGLIRWEGSETWTLSSLHAG